jgi:putative tryptophan/tyrosine transport system substrate-binding protein
MRRRDFIAGVGASATWPLASLAQQDGRVRLVGMINGGTRSNPTAETYYSLFVQGLEEFGWVNGRNLRIEARWAGGNVERMRTFARELEDLRSDVIVVTSGVATKVVQEQIRSIPIVFVFAGDPITNGFVDDIARPEGNMTGVTDWFSSIGSKWLQLLKEVRPSLTRVVVVFNPDFHNEATMMAIEDAATSYHVTVTKAIVRDSTEIASALDAFAVEANGAVIAMPPIQILPRGAELINERALRHGLPTIYNDGEQAAKGGLMSYGPVIADLFRRGAPNYVDRILHGAKPNDLPVQYPTKFKFIINLKTAKAIGVVFPPSLIALADEVIE